MARNRLAPEVVEHLTDLFRKNGYVRWPNRDRRAAEKDKYKKGYEVRLVATSPTELQFIRRLLAAAGFDLANPFPKARQWRQPVYGKEAVSRFLAMVGWDPEGEAGGDAAGPAPQPDTRGTTP